MTNTNITIERTVNKEVTILDLVVGDYFLHENDLHQKIEIMNANQTVNCIEPKTGRLFQIEDHEEIFIISRITIGLIGLGV